MHKNEFSAAEKMAMISLCSQDWQGSNDPSQDELFQALIDLIQLGKIVAFYDNAEGCVKYQANRALSEEPRKYYWAYDPE
jgi:hypothetical protein